MNTTLRQMLRDVQACQLCAEHLPLPPRPVISLHADTRILIIGQAPGVKVHEAGIPWHDKSGETLRQWLGVTESQFRDARLFGTMPMGFCYPGTKPGGGDLPPRPECAPHWHGPLLDHLPNVRLQLIIGQYAIRAYLPDARGQTLTDCVRQYRDYLPDRMPLVHPSPLNFRWHKRNPWFMNEVIPQLQPLVAEIIA